MSALDILLRRGELGTGGGIGMVLTEEDERNRELVDELEATIDKYCKEIEYADVKVPTTWEDYIGARVYLCNIPGRGRLYIGERYYSGGGGDWYTEYVLLEDERDAIKHMLSWLDEMIDYIQESADSGDFPEDVYEDVDNTIYELEEYKSSLRRELRPRPQPT